MTIVYRVETECGVGMYNLDWPFGAECSLPSAVHPMPDLDIAEWDVRGMLHNICASDWYFGFESIAQLCRWIAEDYREIASSYGLFVSVYELSDDYIMFGGRQLAFIKQNAVYHGSYDMADLDSIPTEAPQLQAA